jgi:hypothetical protein
MNIHKLKLHKDLFNDTCSGIKRFEIRKDDRGFQVGDVLILEVWDEDANKYTGDWVKVFVTYILRDTQYGMSPDHVIMSTKILSTGLRELEHPSFLG